MNVIVHLLFSYHVRKIIKEDTGVGLNLLGFMVGNILPDIRARFNSQPHYIDDSLNFVIKSSNYIMKNDDELARNSYKYSKKLGVIIHYLSDYFCYPHQAHYDEGLKKHIIYELIMTARYRKGLKNYRARFRHESRDLPPENFKKWILERNQNYNGQDACCVNDVSHAIHAGSLIGRNVVMNSALLSFNKDLPKSITPSGI